MEAVILVGGEGTRLRPLTLNLPKALVPINGVPLIQFILTWLRSCGIQQVFIASGYLKQKIVDFCADGSNFQLSITHSHEEVPLGTAGAVKKLEGHLGDTFIVVYGDVLTNLDLRKMIRFHKSKRGLVTLAIRKNVHALQAGVVCINEQKRVTDFIEKPPQVKTEHIINGGIYILEKGIFEYIPDDGHCDFGYDVFPRLINSGIPVYGYSLRDEEYLMDVGSWECYHRASEDIKLGKVRFTL